MQIGLKENAGEHIEQEFKDVCANFGKRSVAGLELARLRFAYYLNSRIKGSLVDYRMVAQSLSDYSESYNGTCVPIKLVPEANSEQQQTHVYKPISERNLSAYEKQHFRLSSHIQKGPEAIPEYVAPLRQYSYVIGPDYQLRWLSIPNRVSDTILKRRVIDGKPVHPAIANEFSFRVLCAGEFSVADSNDPRNRVFTITNCSGHYQPKDLTPSAMWNLTRRAFSLASDENVVLLTSQHTAITDRMKINYIEYEK